jgi:hypothetical protein
LRFIIARKWPCYNGRYLWLGLVWSVCAACCFFTGLNDEADFVNAPQWLIASLGAHDAAAQEGDDGPVPDNVVKLERAYHGAWHICAGALFYCLVRAGELPQHISERQMKDTSP